MNDQFPSPDRGDDAPAQPWADAHVEAAAGGAMPPSRSSRIGAVLAWMTILLVVGVLVWPARTAGESGPGDNSLALLMTELMGKYIVGAADWLGPETRSMFRGELDQMLGSGSIAQQQRHVVLVAELGGAREAADELHQLNLAIDEKMSSDAGEGEPDACLTNGRESLLRVQAILSKLYPKENDSDQPRVSALDDDERALLRDELGWFGDLALVPPKVAGDAERRDVLAPARRLTAMIVLVGLAMIALGFAGLAGLIVLIVLAGQRRLTSGLAERGGGPHGIYAETFAIWMLVFVALQFGASYLGARAPDHQLFIAFLAFLCSLGALGWPVLRGVPWRTTRSDIGLTLGRKPAMEPFVGVAGYALALPILAVGIVIMLTLMVIQQFLQGGGGEPLSPQSGPAHPIVLEVARGGWWQAIQLLLVAAVAAPIVEETMFRGVLYRHLRDASRSMGIGASIVLGAAVNSFIFAIIHPQGWLAAPALMSLAITFTILREWRGTVLPAIVTHSLWNGAVMLLLIAALRG